LQKKYEVIFPGDKIRHRIVGMTQHAMFSSPQVEESFSRNEAGMILKYKINYCLLDQYFIFGCNTIVVQFQ
jgi:hypothetical protein